MLIKEDPGTKMMISKLNKRYMALAYIFNEIRENQHL